MSSKIGCVVVAALLWVGCGGGDDDGDAGSTDARERGVDARDSRATGNDGGAGPSDTASADSPAPAPEPDGAVDAPRSTDGASMETASQGGTLGDAGFAIPGGAPPTVSQLCSAMCERVSTCDQMKDRQTCTQSCINVNASLVGKLRGDVLRAVLGWVTATDCRSVLMPDFFKAALRTGAMLAQPSAASMEFCDAYFKRADECLGTTNKMECLERSKVYSDEAIAAAQACLPKTCPNIGPCVVASLHAVTGTEALGGGISSIARCLGTRQPCMYYASEMECSRGMGCTASFGCQGSPSCSYHNAQMTCAAEPGCTWQPSLYCSGSPTTACAGRAMENCRNGCTWRVICMGTPAPCDAHSVAQCPTTQGCRVTDGTTPQQPF